jgi:uncharacterized Zn-binding protein involved in type VI secretion
VIWQCKNHRLEICDEEGKECFTISTAEGKMRFSLDKAGGVFLVNELGGITLRCRKLTIKASSVIFASEKDCALHVKEQLSCTVKKCCSLEAAIDLTVKGKKITLKGQKGVTSGGKQLAAQDDKVLGFDIHQMVVPSGSGTAIVPLPHPYLGKLNDKLSDDVSLGSRHCALEGSESKHDDAMHLQLPGTLSFQKNPDKKGAVTGGTADKLTINGKAAALIGSTVTTCNDTGARDNSTVIAAGASAPMPVISNPLGAKDYGEERASGEGKRPEITQARWGKETCREGEVVELLASVRDIADGNGITFQVWREGDDPAVHVSVAQLHATLDGGSAGARFCYSGSADAEPPDADPVFFFTAHCAWCTLKKSDNTLSVALRRPKLSNPVWKDKGGKAVAAAVLGEELELGVSCNGDVGEGEGILFRVYPDGADPAWVSPLGELVGENRGGAASVRWVYPYRHDPEQPLTEKPRLFFTAGCSRSKDLKSGAVEIGANVNITVLDIFENPLKKIPYTLYHSNGSEMSEESDDAGIIHKDGLIPGMVYLMIRKEDASDE